jgi:hypothetical protein
MKIIVVLDVIPCSMVSTNVSEEPAASTTHPEDGSSRFLQNIGTCLPN